MSWRQTVFCILFLSESYVGQKWVFEFLLEKKFFFEFLIFKGYPGFSWWYHQLSSVDGTINWAVKNPGFQLTFRSIGLMMFSNIPIFLFPTSYFPTYLPTYIEPRSGEDVFLYWAAKRRRCFPILSREAAKTSYYIEPRNGEDVFLHTYFLYSYLPILPTYLPIYFP